MDDFELDPERALWKPSRRSFFFGLGAALVIPVSAASRLIRMSKKEVFKIPVSTFADRNKYVPAGNGWSRVQEFGELEFECIEYDWIGAKRLSLDEYRSQFNG